MGAGATFYYSGNDMVEWNCLIPSFLCANNYRRQQRGSFRGRLKQYGEWRTERSRDIDRSWLYACC